jgi:hypothetical protein
VRQEAEGLRSEQEGWRQVAIGLAAKVGGRNKLADLLASAVLTLHWPHAPRGEGDQTKGYCEAHGGAAVTSG